jgi:flagellar hook protein FlgE
MSFGAFFTAVTGLNAHNTWMKVIGDNIANMNTAGFKRSVAHFATLLEAPTCDPKVGLGVRAMAYGVFTQGPVIQTSRPLDVALQGEGFFALDQDGREVYSRDGAFDFDKEGVLHHIASGAVALGSDDQPLTAPVTLISEPSASTEVSIEGNFNASSTGPTAEVLKTRTALQTTAGAAAQATTALNDLSANTTDYTNGDTITVTGRDVDGNSRSAVFVYGSESGQNGTSLGALINFINGSGTGEGGTTDKFPGATLALDTSGNLSFTADTPGDVDLELALEDGLTKADGSPQAGRTNFQRHNFDMSTEGADPDSFSTAIEIYDAKGQPRALNLKFTRVESEPCSPVWDMEADIAGATFTDNVVHGIRFNPDGSFGGITGTGAGDANITFQIPNCPAKTLRIYFGEPGSFDGATQFGGINTASATKQNGWPTGYFQGADFDTHGNLTVTFTNGKTENRGQLKVVTFPDVESLARLGDNLYSRSPATGDPAGGLLETGATTILPHYLEGSNVDQAYELLNMIVAQNGFAANAKTITASNEMFDTLVALLR